MSTSSSPPLLDHLRGIPVISKTGGLASSEIAQRPPRMTRRSMLKVTAGLVGGIGLAALGVFPRARAALAGNYDVYGSCPGSIAGTCWPGCGPSFASGSYCKSNSSPLTWHKDSLDNSGPYSYKLRPNVCEGGWADAWLWANDSSCSCSNKKWRCHDGYSRYLSGTWTPIICRYCTF